MSITSEPGAHPPMEKKPFYKRALTKVSTREGWLGDYDYRYMCLPQFPYGKRAVRKAPPFYSLEADLPLVLAIVCGESPFSPPPSLHRVWQSLNGRRR
jgi:hypothetical protein